MLFQPILTLLLVSLVPSVLSAFSPTTSELESRRAHHHGAHGQSFDSNFAQHAPSAAPSSSRRAVHKRTIIPATLPLGTRNDLARCPETMMACPISALPTETEWECVHPDEDLYSCGGCSTMSTGEDCTSISSAQSVSCEAGACRGTLYFGLIQRSSADPQQSIHANTATDRPPTESRVSLSLPNKGPDDDRSGTKALPTPSPS